MVMCFDSDAPRSKRLCYYGTDDVTCGKVVMEELARPWASKGTIAILAGNQTAPNLQKRVQGVKESSRSYPDMKLLDGRRVLPSRNARAGRRGREHGAEHAPGDRGLGDDRRLAAVRQERAEVGAGRGQSGFRGCAAGAARLSETATSQRCTPRTATAGATSPSRSCWTRS